MGKAEPAEPAPGEETRDLPAPREAADVEGGSVTGPSHRDPRPGNRGGWYRHAQVPGRRHQSSFHKRAPAAPPRARARKCPSGSRPVLTRREPLAPRVDLPVRYSAVPLALGSPVPGNPGGLPKASSNASNRSSPGSRRLRVWFTRCVNLCQSPTRSLLCSFFCWVATCKRSLPVLLYSTGHVGEGGLDPRVSGLKSAGVQNLV